VSRRSPRPGVKRVYEPSEASSSTRGARRPHLAARAHEGSWRVAEGLRPRAQASGPGLAMTRTAGASFTSHTSRSSAPITPQSWTWRILYRRAKSRCSSTRTTPSATVP